MGKVVRHAVVPTAIGPVLLAATDKGLCALRMLPTEEDAARSLRDLRASRPEAEFRADPAGLRELARKVREVVAGSLPASAIPLDVEGTDLQKAVWRRLVKLPWGKTVSYAQLARMVGHPRAVRGVASACARNPVGFVVPCHRVVRTGGGLGGYYWGLDRKRWLLEREQG